MKVLTAVAVLVLGITVSAGCDGQKLPATVARVVSEEYICEAPRGLLNYDKSFIRTSRDGRRLAYFVMTSQEGFGRRALVVNGIMGKEYGNGREHDPPVFSPDSEHVAITAREGNKQFVVIDGVEGKRYDQIPRLLRGPRRGSRGLGISQSYIPCIRFSADSRRTAYPAQAGSNQFVVVDGAEGKPYDEIGYICFSPDSKRIAYVAGLGGKQFVVIDGVEGKRYDEVWYIVFSPDGEHISYEAKDGSGFLVVVDGIEGKRYDELAYYTLTFSPDSRHMAYAASDLKSEEGFVVIDGMEGKRRGAHFGSLVFSPDSNQVARSGFTWRRYPVTDEVEVVEVDTVDTPVYSPDSRRLLVVGKKWPFLANALEYVTVDGMKGTAYDYVSGPCFSPDSKHVVYAAGAIHRYEVPGAATRYTAAIVVDGSEIKEYDGLMFGITATSPWFGEKDSRIVFDSPDSFHFLALKGDSIYLVGVKIE